VRHVLHQPLQRFANADAGFRAVLRSDFLRPTTMTASAFAARNPEPLTGLLPVMKRLAMLATILTVATSCDKAKEFVRSGQSAGPPQVDPSEALDLATKPTILFQVFGESSDPRMIPVAAVQDGKVRQITLSRDGWEQFDAMYLRRGKSYNIYRDGAAVGIATVRQGMWERAEPLYSLPGCRTLTPLAAVTLDRKLDANFAVEFLATADTFARPRSAPAASTAQVTRQARALGYELGTAANIARATLDSLDFRAIAVPTGANGMPTLIGSFIDPTVEDASSASALMVHLFFIAEMDSTGHYRATYLHRVNGPLETAAFRRYSDHADITGDGIDEIVLEGWQYRGDTFMLVLAYSGGDWTEVFRSRPNWCLDERRR
jgi:hypothetical protein